MTKALSVPKGDDVRCEAISALIESLGIGKAAWNRFTSRHDPGTANALGIVLVAGLNFSELAVDSDSSESCRLHYSPRIDASSAYEPFSPILARSRIGLPPL